MPSSSPENPQHLAGAEKGPGPGVWGEPQDAVWDGLGLMGGVPRWGCGRLCGQGGGVTVCHQLSATGAGPAGPRQSAPAEGVTAVPPAGGTAAFSGGASGGAYQQPGGTSPAASGVTVCHQLSATGAGPAGPRQSAPAEGVTAVPPAGGTAAFSGGASGGAYQQPG